MNKKNRTICVKLATQSCKPCFKKASNFQTRLRKSVNTQMNIHEGKGLKYALY